MNSCSNTRPPPDHTVFRPCDSTPRRGFSASAIMGDMRTEAVAAAIDAAETYNELRESCYKTIKANPDVLGPDMWLRYAITEFDLNMIAPGPDGIHIDGRCFSTQTQDNEDFSCFIGWDLLNPNLLTLIDSNPDPARV